MRLARLTTCQCEAKVSCSMKKFLIKIENELTDFSEFV